MKLKFLLVLIFAITLAACSDKDKADEDANDGDTSQMVRGVLFSSIMLNDFLQLEDDEDLGMYLETEIYPQLAGSTRVTMDRLTGSVYSLEFDSAGTMRSYIIERFYDPKSEKTFFVKSVNDGDDSSPEDTTGNK